MGGPKDAPGNLFIFVFRNPGKGEKGKEPEYLKMHRIQASEAIVDSLENLLHTFKNTSFSVKNIKHIKASGIRFDKCL